MPGENRNYDLGALKLDCEIGNLTGWVGVRALADSEIGLKTSVHGYAADLAPPGRQWISEDEIRALWEFKGFYQNDTYGGTSGSPVFATGTNNMMIGVHTNGLHGKEEPWASHNAFTRITPARLEVIREWIRFSPGGQP
jgi:putative chitinase